MSDWRRFSRLPQSAAYWQQLTARMQQSAHDSAAFAPEPVRSLAPLAWTAFAAALAAAIVSVWLPASPGNSVSLPALLAPADSTGAVWVARSAPPDAAEVLLGWSR